VRWLLVLAAAGCGFSHGRLQNSADDDAGLDSDDASSDGPVIDARIDAPAAVICNAADLDLRSCFTFDGSVSEGSSYSHGTSVANVSFVAGHDNQAVAIQSGSNITITGTPTSFDVTTFTFRMWIKPSSLPAASTRMGLLDSGNRYRMFLLPGGALRCALTGGPDLVSVTGIVSTGVWQRVACTFDGTFTRIYVNGVKKAELMQTATVGTSTSGIVIGQNNPSGENFDGAMDSFQLWGSIVAP
jgi:hypothetical protein